MKKTRPVKRRLSICPLEIYDSTVGVWPQIGVKASYSDTLLKNLSASVIADHSGLASVDYAKKRYLKDWERQVDLAPEAFDIKTIHFLESSILELQKHAIANSHILIYSSNQAICDLTLAKGLGTLMVALDLSSKGLLHEVLALCRSSLEMIAWAFTVFDLPDEKDPFDLQPERAVSSFKGHCPYAGKYYGYLSTFAHWRKETHTRVLQFEKEYTAVLYASGRNKWEAMANVILMTRLYGEAYITKYTPLKCKKGGKSCLPEIQRVSEKISERQKQWLAFLAGLEEQRLSKSFAEILMSVHKA